MKKNFVRKKATRKFLSRYYFIAEGEKTEKEYLRELWRLFDTVFSPIRRTHSATGYILKSIEKNEKELSPKDYERLLVFVDKDSWEIQDLEKLFKWEKEDEDKRLMILSNPCFELWLLRHYEQGKGVYTAQDCHNKLKKYKPSLSNKSVPVNTFTEEQVLTACENAKAGNTTDWKEPGFTNCYLLIEEIIQKREENKQETVE